MKIIKNDKLIKRNGRIGSWTSMGALLVLALGMYVSIKRQDLILYAIGALILGFMMTQVGMYFSNRWGRSPRPDEQLDAGLKGLPNDTGIYHYVTPVAHLLLGPAGLWVLMPYHQRGRLTYEKNRWKLTGGGIMQIYMSIFGQEGLGRPDLDTATEIEALKKYLTKELGDTEIPEIKAALVFTSDQIEIEAEDSPLPALPIKKLKDFIRQKAREKNLDLMTLERIRAIFPQ